MGSEPHTDSTGDQARIADNVSRTVDKAALRKVRNLVDDLEVEQRNFNVRQKWAVGGGLAVLLAVLVIISLRKSGERPDALRLECEQREWQNAHAAATAALRSREPGLAHVDIQRRLEAQRDALLLQARKACAHVPRD